MVVRGVWCGEQHDWREANGLLTIQASCSSENTWVSRAPARACDTMNVVLKHLERFQLKRTSLLWLYRSKRFLLGFRELSGF